MESWQPAFWFTIPTNWFYTAGSNSIVEDRCNNIGFVERNTVVVDIVGHTTVVVRLRVGDSDRNLVVWLDAIESVVVHIVGYLGNRGLGLSVDTPHPVGR